jgi:hypothetical protein
MILFYGEGRLGNQIFQYRALTQMARPGERIIAIGLEDLTDAFDLGGPGIIVLSRNLTVKRLVKFLLIPLLLRPLTRLFRLANYASERVSGRPPHDGPSGEPVIVAGLIRHVTFVDGGHYQNASIWQALFPTTLMKLKPILRESAKRHLDSMGTAPMPPTFVHVRRGDYLSHKTYGLESLSLPESYYRHAIRELELRVGQTHLVFVTDDPAWVQENFRDISGKSVVSGSPILDFAIMAECVNGIISNSTFALAAAFMLKNPEIVIAPEYWFGFRIREWYPPKIFCSHAKLLYVPVES